MRRGTRICPTFGFAVALSALLTGACQKKDPPSFERPPAAVTVATAAVRDVPVYLDEVGKCVAREVVSIQPQVSGRIAEIHFEDGADLKKGDLLFTIDPGPYRAAARTRREANLARAKAALEPGANADSTRAETLSRRKIVSQAGLRHARRARSM